MSLISFIQIHQLLYEKVIQQKTFKFITFGDWEFMYQLPLESQKKGVSLNQSMKNYVNVLMLAFEVYGPQVTAQIASFEDIQKQFGFKVESSSQTRTKVETLLLFYTDFLAKQFNNLNLQR